MPKPSHTRVTAHAIDDDGRGVATALDAAGAPDGAWRLDVRVADLLPGESAVVAVEHVSRHRPRAWARVVQRVGPPAPDRVRPACPAFGQCGGCVWQHLAYPAQLVHKRARVVAALAARGVAGVARGPAVEPAVAAPSPLEYRSKAVYVIGAGAARPASGPRAAARVLGAYAPRTHAVVDTAGCRVVEPAIERTRAALCAALSAPDLARALPVYDERTRAGALRYAVVRAGADGRAAAGLVTTAAVDHGAVAAAAERAVALAGGVLAGVAWIPNDATTGAVLGDRVEAVVGDPVVRERVAGVDIAVGVGAFFQVNRAQAARLYDLVVELGRPGPGQRAVDLYCGAGPIALSLARAGADVVGVERNPAAVAVARAAARSAGLAGRLRFEEGDAGRLPDAGGDAAPDLVVVNPPRKGLSAAARRAVVAAAPPRLVYVSCGPDSLARDLAELVAAGYAVERVIPVDLMPGTPQIETVAVLSR